MGYLDELRAFVSENTPDALPTKPTKPEILSSVGSVSDPMGHVLGKKVFDSWCSAVQPLDPRKPNPGSDAARWYNLVEASFWFVENFGRQAALDGWQTGDVFGVRPGFDREGGLIDRLETARSLVIEGKRARWRSFGVVMKFNAGAYPDLPAFWEVS